MIYADDQVLNLKTSVGFVGNKVIGLMNAGVEEIGETEICITDVKVDHQEGVGHREEVDLHLIGADRRDEVDRHTEEGDQVEVDLDQEMTGDQLSCKREDALSAKKRATLKEIAQSLEVEAMTTEEVSGEMIATQEVGPLLDDMKDLEETTNILDGTHRGREPHLLDVQDHQSDLDLDRDHPNPHVDIKILLGMANRAVLSFAERMRLSV